MSNGDAQKDSENFSNQKKSMILPKMPKDHHNFPKQQCKPHTARSGRDNLKNRWENKCVRPSDPIERHLNRRKADQTYRFGSPAWCLGSRRTQDRALPVASIIDSVSHSSTNSSIFNGILPVRSDTGHYGCRCHSCCHQIFRRNTSLVEINWRSCRKRLSSFGDHWSSRKTSLRRFFCNKILKYSDWTDTVSLCYAEALRRCRCNF